MFFNSITISTCKTYNIWDSLFFFLELKKEKRKKKWSREKRKTLLERDNFVFNLFLFLNILFKIKLNQRLEREEERRERERKEEKRKGENLFNSSFSFWNERRHLLEREIMFPPEHMSSSSQFLFQGMKLPFNPHLSLSLFSLSSLFSFIKKNSRNKNYLRQKERLFVQKNYWLLSQKISLFRFSRNLVPNHFFFLSIMALFFRCVSFNLILYFSLSWCGEAREKCWEDFVFRFFWKIFFFFSLSLSSSIFLIFSSPLSNQGEPFRHPLWDTMVSRKSFWQILFQKNLISCLRRTSRRKRTGCFPSTNPKCQASHHCRFWKRSPIFHFHNESFVFFFSDFFQKRGCWEINNSNKLGNCSCPKGESSWCFGCRFCSIELKLHEKWI